jgi:co-chaperonin GroES (HSP10)
MMENKSGLEPCGHAVLLESYEPERKAGAIMIPDAVRSRLAMVDSRAVVVAVGPDAWTEDSGPRAQVGDRVLVTSMAGFSAKGPADGRLYRLVNDRDIFCKITAEDPDYV